MTLSESVAKLSTLLPLLKANDAKFASDLIASFKRYGGLTPKQEPWIERLIARAVAPAAKPVAAAVNVGNFAGVVALFDKAKASGLKFPKVRLSLNGTALIFSLNGPKSKAPGAVSINGEGKYPYRAYFGRVTPEGTFLSATTPLAGLVDLLNEFAKNPARVAKDYGKLTGNCCFCGKALGLGKEQRSVLVGFGPDCAENYGLKAEWLAAADKAEAKASVLVTAMIPAEATEVAISPAAMAKMLTMNGLAPKAVAPTVEPTLTVSPAAQATIDGLAESLAKATSAVAVTVPAVAAFAAATAKLSVQDEVVESLTKTWAPGTSNETANGTPLNTLGQPMTAAADTSYGPNPGDMGDYEPLITGVAGFIGAEAETAGAAMAAAVLTAEGAADKVELKECFFCEMSFYDTKTLHGYVVCPSCVAQLK